MSDDWANSPIPDLDVDAAQAAEPLTAEELEEWKRTTPNPTPNTDWHVTLTMHEFLGFIATIDARDAALRQAEEEIARLTEECGDTRLLVMAVKAAEDAADTAEEAIRKGYTWDQYQSALREGR